MGDTAVFKLKIHILIFHNQTNTNITYPNRSKIKTVSNFVSTNIEYTLNSCNLTQFFSPKKGERLNFAMDESDVTVRIGKEFCNVTLLASNMLTCIPPKTQPEAGDKLYGPGMTPAVTVRGFY